MNPKWNYTWHLQDDKKKIQDFIGFPWTEKVNLDLSNFKSCLRNSEDFSNILQFNLTPSP